jgi:hypothetical protein
MSTLLYPDLVGNMSQGNALYLLWNKDALEGGGAVSCFFCLSG